MRLHSFICTQAEKDWFLCTVFFFNLSSALQEVVETPYGKIYGTREYFENTPVLAFLGIPYAKPPVGGLRFRRTSPMESWTHQPIVANRTPPACIQYSPHPFPWLDDQPDHSEDCLYLNLWSPAHREPGDLAILLWIHGGGFRIGSGRLDIYNGRVMAATQNVIVVTLNYRLGPMGFLYFGTEDAPGNMGLYDILEAMKWVQKFIRFFGGDPERVTVFGVSSGSIAAGMLYTSPLAVGLFRRVALSGGSAVNLDGEDRGRDSRISRRIAEIVGCTSDNVTADNREVLQCLRGVEGLRLTKAMAEASEDPHRSLYPRHGDDLLPTNAREALMSGCCARDLDVLIGANSGEGSTMITKAFEQTFGFFGEKNPCINRTFGESIIRENFKNFPQREAVVQHYLGDVSEDDCDTVLYRVFTASGDFARICPSLYFADIFGRRGQVSYFYFFHHRPSRSPWAPWMLAAHSDEVQFLFGLPLRDGAPESEQRLSRDMMHAWASFAKTGSPEQSEWKPHTLHRPNIFLIDTDSDGRGFQTYQRNCEFFRPFFGF